MPLTRPAAGRKATPPAARAHCRPPLVLLVDDDEETRELDAIEPARAGFRIDHASNGQEALGKVFIVNPPVVVMDLSMPVLDGWEATRQIRADPRRADIRRSARSRSRSPGMTLPPQDGPRWVYDLHCDGVT